MFTFFAADNHNNAQIEGDNIIYSFLFLMLSVTFLSHPVAAQRGGGGFHGGGGGGYYGGGYHGYGGGSGGGCDTACVTVFGIMGGVIAVPVIACVMMVICCMCSNKKETDDSLALDCPYDNPQHWLSGSGATIINMSDEHSDLIEQLKSNPHMLNHLWEGKYIDSDLVGFFIPTLFFSWNHEKNLMEFKSQDDEKDDYGHYRIINGMFNFENKRFVAHKEYFNPSQQSDPYTIVQAGHIEFATKNDQICLGVNGTWYSTYNHSVKGLFEYNKALPDVALTNKCESYGTFGR